MENKNYCFEVVLEYNAKMRIISPDDKLHNGAFSQKISLFNIHIKTDPLLYGNFAGCFLAKHDKKEGLYTASQGNVSLGCPRLTLSSEILFVVQAVTAN